MSIDKVIVGRQVALFEDTIVADVHTTEHGSALSLVGNIMVHVMRSSFRNCSSASYGGAIFLDIKNRYDICMSCFYGCKGGSHGSVFYTTSTDTAINDILFNSMSFCPLTRQTTYDVVYPIKGIINYKLNNNSYSQIGTSGCTVLYSCKSKETTMCTNAHGISDISFCLIRTREDYDFVVSKYNTVNLTKGSNSHGIFCTDNSDREVVDGCVVIRCEAISITQGYSGGTTPILKNCLLFGNKFDVKPQIEQEENEITSILMEHLEEWDCYSVPSHASSAFTLHKLMGIRFCGILVLQISLLNES